MDDIQRREDHWAFVDLAGKGGHVRMVPVPDWVCARLCHVVGGELEQIQFQLGHVWVQTTEKYFGCKQRIRNAVNDRIGIEPSP